MHLNEETIKSETVFEGKILYVTRDVAKLENGREVIRDVIHHNGGVCVVPLTEQGQVLMVRQFRYPHHCVTLEVPAGKLEQGEEPLTCGIRELWEETGARAESMEYLGSLFPTPAYDTEVIHMYLAKGLQVGGQPEAGSGRVRGRGADRSAGGGKYDFAERDPGRQDPDRIDEDLSAGAAKKAGNVNIPC